MEEEQFFFNLFSIRVVHQILSFNLNSEIKLYNLKKVLQKVSSSGVCVVLPVLISGKLVPATRNHTKSKSQKSENGLRQIGKGKSSFHHKEENEEVVVANLCTVKDIKFNVITTTRFVFVPGRTNFAFLFLLEN